MIPFIMLVAPFAVLISWFVYLVITENREPKIKAVKPVKEPKPFTDAAHSQKVADMRSAYAKLHGPVEGIIAQARDRRKS